MIVRDERPEDAPAIRQVLEEAFGQTAEADLVDRLHDADTVSVSAVAVHRSGDDETGPDRIIGHILFSMVTIGGRHPAAPAVGLAPMAVTPSHQRCGVGTALVETGLERCRDDGVGLVVVLGHPAYYPRFGFRPAHLSSLSCEYASPPEAFMVLELTQGVLSACAGVVRYHPVFGELG